ncbi:MAG: hypothetical protein H7328_03885 [Bdellovibrio sp.]|nr:hypothetical protein [Bdellovibrio sp.]
MKPLLSKTSSALLKFHRELLLFQTTLAEKSDNRKYTPYELLHLSLNDARFNWLRKFSELIIQIDIITDDKENKPFDAHAIVKEIKILISNGSQNEDFNFALKSDTSLMLSLGGVRAAISELEKSLKNEVN